MPLNCHCLEKIGHSPTHFSQASISTKGHGGPCCLILPIFMSWIHYPDGHSSKENCWKLKLESLKSSWPLVKQQLNTWFSLFIEIPDKPSAGTHLSIQEAYGSLLYEIKTCNPSPSCAFFSFIPFQYWCKSHHPKYPTSLECHHMMPDVTMWSPQWCHALFGGNSYTCIPGTLSGHLHSENGWWSRCSHPPYMESEIATPGAYHDTYTGSTWVLT